MRPRGRCGTLGAPPRRRLSTAPPAGGRIFNTRAKIMQRERGARSPESPSCDYIREEVAARLVDRLRDIHGFRYPLAVDLMCHAGQLSRKLQARELGIEHVFACDTSAAALTRDDATAGDAFAASPLEDVRTRSEPLTPPAPSGRSTADVTRLLIAPDTLPFARRSLDLVISNLALHWTDDLGALVASVHRALKPNGLFIASLLGGRTLRELKEAFMVAEQEREGGISPHVSPMAGVSDVGNALSAAGFALITVDTDEFKIRYADPFVLMHDLRVMGEGNASVQRRAHTPRDTLYAAAAAYQALHGLPADASVPATFQVIYLIGWVPHENQPRAKKRGSATVSLKDLASVVGKTPTGLEEIPDEEPPTQGGENKGK